MPRGQFYTVFTLGFATAIGFLGVLAGVACWYWPEPTAWANFAIGAPGRPATWVTSTILGLAVAAAGIAIGYWMVQIQQAIVHWQIDRLLAKLSDEHRTLAQTLGTERADELMGQKAAAMAEASHFNLFGRDEMLQAMRAAGQRPVS